MMTKVVWGNAALVSPKTAKDLGVEDGDIVKLSRGAVMGEFAIMLPARPRGWIGFADARLRPLEGRPGGQGSRLQCLRAAHDGCLLVGGRFLADQDRQARRAHDHAASPFDSKAGRCCARRRSTNTRRIRR